MKNSCRPSRPRPIFPSFILVVALFSALELRAAVPVWPKVTPADVTAAGLDVQLTGVDYGNSTFVLATYFGGSPGTGAITPVFFTSPDGSTWTRRNVTGVTGRTGAPRFLNGKFLVGVTPDSLTGGNGVILSSTDGSSWTSSAILGSTINAPGEFAYGNGVYVAPLSSPAAQIATSTDGVTWTNRVIVAGGSSSHITFFKGKFYANCYGDGIGGLYSSSDAVSWSRVSGAPANIGPLAASSSTLLVSVFDTSFAVPYLSTDGATFTAASPGLKLKSETVRFLNGAFVVTDAASDTSFDLTLASASTDGNTWTAIGSADNQFYASEVAYGNGTYVFVGEFNVFAGTTTISPGGGGSSSAPVFTTQPTSQSASVGASVTFTAAATGSPAPSYQWRRNDSNIPGATSATLTLANVQTSQAGYYTVVAYNSSGSTLSTTVTLTVVPTAYLSNLSVRAAYTSGKTLIAGFVVSGGAKPMLVRAGGPLLNRFGLTGVTDPSLSLYSTASSPATLVTSNDNWDSTATPSSLFNTLGAQLFDASSKDAALQRTINGAHTANVTATNAGQVIAEVYDAGPNDGRRLTNLSARFQVGTGDNLLIGGFVVGGTGTLQVLVRAVGAKLADYGVTGVLADPQFTVFDGTTAVDTNDDWASSLSSTFTTVGAFALTTGTGLPTNDTKSAAKVLTLTAGKVYTVQVSGTGGSTGEALVELYTLP